MTGKNRRHYHCKALNSLLCADVPLRNYSLTPYGRGATSENRLKIGVLQGVGQYPPNFRIEGDVPINHFYTDR